MTIDEIRAFVEQFPLPDVKILVTVTEKDAINLLPKIKDAGFFYFLQTSTEPFEIVVTGKKNS